MLSAVALVNQALEAGNLQQFSSSLVSPSAGLCDVDHSVLDRYACLSLYLCTSLPVYTCQSDDSDVIIVVFRYFECLLAVKQKAGKDLLTWNQLQEGINCVNNSVQDEHQRM